MGMIWLDEGNYLQGYQGGYYKNKQNLYISLNTKPKKKINF